MRHETTYKPGRNIGLKPYVICHLLSIHAPAGSKQAHRESTKAIVRRLYRPDDMSSAKAYSLDIREVAFLFMSNIQCIIVAPYHHTFVSPPKLFCTFDL